MTFGGPHTQRRFRNTLYGWERHVKTFPHPRKKRRGILIPQQIFEVKITEPGGIDAGGSGEVTFTIDEVAVVPERKVTAHLGPVDGDEAAFQDIFGYVEFFRNAKKWRFVSLDCNPIPQPAPPGHGDNITATISPNNVQDSCELLSFISNRITVCANNDDAVQLPGNFEQGGPPIRIQNAGARRLKIIPSDSDKVDAGTAGDAGGFVTLPSGASVVYSLVQFDEWVS